MFFIIVIFVVINVTVLRKGGQQMRLKTRLGYIQPKSAPTVNPSDTFNMGDSFHPCGMLG